MGMSDWGALLGLAVRTRNTVLTARLYAALSGSTGSLGPAADVLDGEVVPSDASRTIEAEAFSSCASWSLGWGKPVLVFLSRALGRVETGGLGTALRGGLSLGGIGTRVVVKSTEGFWVVAGAVNSGGGVTKVQQKWCNFGRDFDYVQQRLARTNHVQNDETLLTTSFIRS
ncbi:hypothetical protein PHYPSEUDO_005107 [Phytophthora pseudosyringae]|uniref:Uncharacterized protein n=1 Tax=Phytophthora pseudosyringae TaxID=221518 RepID=A0A8T1VLR6_9STRA|nr:hypothetical protein PHYPSEUDO_005107 [Phytophthora pseudosyringae]